MRVALTIISIALVALSAQGCRLDGLSGADPFTLQQNAGSAGANCKVSSARQLSIARVRERLGSAGSEICLQPTQYSCTRRSFAPDVASQSHGTETQCVDLPELGGKACLGIESFFFNTAQAAGLPGTPPEATAPGGDYNHDEYVCHHVALQDGETFLATGQGAQLAQALQAAFDQCAQALSGPSPVPAATSTPKGGIDAQAQ